MPIEGRLDRCSLTTIMIHPTSCVAGAQDELTSTVVEAVQSLSVARKANFLLETSLNLIDSGKCVDLVNSISYKYCYLYEDVDMGSKLRSIWRFICGRQIPRQLMSPRLC
jgi:hypothetical protein